MIHKCYFKLCSYLKERFHPWKQTVLGGFDSNSHLVWWKKEKHFHSHFQQKQFISPLLLENDISPRSKQERTVCGAGYTERGSFRPHEEPKRDRFTDAETTKLGCCCFKFQTFSAVYTVKTEGNKYTWSCF